MTNNFEDIFKKLKDYEIKPRQNLWQGIKNEVVVNNTAEKLKKQKIAPSAKLWNNIKYKLLLHNFFRFSPSTFNVYYLGLISGIIGLIVWLQPANSTNTTISQNLKIKYNNTEVIKETNIKDNTHSHQQANKQNIKLKNSTPQKVLISQNKSSHNIIKTIGKGKINKENSFSIEDKTLNKNTQFTTEVEKHKIVIPKDTFIVYDTIRYYDTVKVIQPKMLEIAENQKGFIAFCSTGGFLTNNTEPVADIHSGLANVTNQAIEAKGHYSVMLEGGFKVAKNLYIGGGVGFSQYFESFKYSLTKLDIDTVERYKYFYTSHYEYNQNNYIKYDTVGQTYSLVHSADSTIDTVWSYDIDTVVYTIVDSFQITTKDSEIVRRIDTNKVTYLYDFINKYSYARLPLFVAYKIKLSSKFDLDIKAGLITNILLNAKGYGISYGDAYDVIDVNKLPLLKFNFETYLGAGISYHLGNHYSLCSEFYYGSTIGSIYSQDYYLRKSFKSFGIKFGFKYGF
jgi:hypothetical protein